MTGDVLQLLRQADPAPGGDGYDDTRIDLQIARILQADADPPPAAHPRRTRKVGMPAIAFAAIAAAGLGTAAAAGWLSPQARNAFDSPDARHMLIGLYGSTANLDQARERVSAAGPDGSTISTWTVPVGNRGVCTAILVSKKSAPLSDNTGLPANLPTTCEQAPAAGQVQRSIRLTAINWRSRITGTEYFIYSGQLGQASRAQLRLANGDRIDAATGDGYYLLPALPLADLTCASLIGLDPLGHQVGLANYLTSGCPGDPYLPGSAAPQPQPQPRPSATVTENSPGQAVGYTDDIGVAVDTVIRQDPNRGAGSSAPGMSLITVRLQFFRQPSAHPTPLPSSVSFDLLYGDDHQPAASDHGMHNDPDLNGVWSEPPLPPGASAPAAWLPQRSFDVPTAELGTLQVRLNGDASHPTIIFGTVRVQR